MKILVSILVLALIAFASSAQRLDYYLPSGFNYSASVPKPADIIHHEVGEWHVTHDRLVNYMQALANAAPDRIKMEVMGYTHERRPQVMLIFTSPSNHARLEEIRQQHVKLTDPQQSAGVNTSTMPIVVWIGHSIHGNEASGSNSSLLTAYHLAAAQGPAIDDLLNNVVVLFDPSFNPDGLQRFSTWVNQHRSINAMVSDANSREFGEAWPGGRFNHYWFDINRDWLPAIHPESQNRLAMFHKWKPNILTDHHEQGSDATFFFQPGVPSRVNPLTPKKNQQLTEALGRYHAKALDSIGSLYFTKENYDDFYYGKGSTYPDINGSIGILFEQASSRGHLRQTSNGELSFPFTIKNQFNTALSTLRGARAMRETFLNWQREFFQSAASNSNQAWVFGDAQDAARVDLFAQMLLRHQVKVYPYETNKAGRFYAVPINQPQATVVKAFFENIPTYADSLFYDITAWNLPLAFGLEHRQENISAAALGTAIAAAPIKGSGVTGGKSSYAYLVEWDDFYAPRLLYELLQKGVNVKVTTNPFVMDMRGEKRFDYGTLIVPLTMQTANADSIYNMLERGAKNYGVTVHALTGGSVLSGSDIGSNKMLALREPKAALVVGDGVNPLDAGEVWHLFDQHMHIPITHLDTRSINSANLEDYNTIIMVGGNYNTVSKERIKSWLQGGGTLICTEEAVQWVAQSELSDVKFKRNRNNADSTARIPYYRREQIIGAQQMNGAIFKAETDLSHPLAYGYHQPVTHFFKANRIFMEKSRNPYGTPFYYGNNALQSGWVSAENQAMVNNSTPVQVSTQGRGRVISISDNPNFRAFWLGGAKLFMNAMFFGRLINDGGGRGEE